MKWASTDQVSDETIFLHKELTRIMAEFAGGLEVDLERVKQSIKDQTRELDSHLESALNHVKTKLQGTLEVALTGFQVSFLLPLVILQLTF